MASPLMSIPAELRLMIYEYLFDAGSHPATIGEEAGPNKKAADRSAAFEKTISIRNSETTAPFPPTQCTLCGAPKPPPPPPTTTTTTTTATTTKTKTPTRSRYRIVQRSFHRRCVETTYRTANEGAYFCTALMRASRALAAETAHALYGAHVFDFGADVEAVRPFLSDLAPATRKLVRRVSLYKRGPWLFDSWSDRCEWRGMCTYLRDHASVEHLRLVVQAGRLREDVEQRHPQRRDVEWEWDAEGPGPAPRALSSEDLALLVDIRHDALDWIGDLARLRNLADVEVLPDFCTVPPPQTSNMFVYLAFSASVDKGFREFLRGRLGLAC
ncbi:hypothetical protein GGS24DRAFT_146707 [Hypoxylon argillaceum]|nr:hypothetical protein GGS24DRAFT_146707 [Hypoxylon argillaceum]